MGPGFVLLFWLVIAGIFAAIWVGCLVLFFVARKKEWKLIKWLTALACGGIALLGLLVAGVFGYGMIRSSIPRYVFEDTFKTKLPVSVVDIKSKVWWFADEGSVYLCFSAEHDVFEKLIPPNIPKLTREEFTKKGWSENTPVMTWWTPITSDTSEIYSLSTEFGKGKEFASESTLMTYDPKRKLVYYHFLGID